MPTCGNSCRMHDVWSPVEQGEGHRACARWPPMGPREVPLACCSPLWRTNPAGAPALNGYRVRPMAASRCDLEEPDSHGTRSGWLRCWSSGGAAVLVAFGTLLGGYLFSARLPPSIWDRADWSDSRSVSWTSRKWCGDRALVRYVLAIGSCRLPGDPSFRRSISVEGFPVWLW